MSDARTSPVARASSPLLAEVAEKSGLEGRATKRGGRGVLTPKSARTAGVVACLIGVLAMVSGRFVAGVPQWVTYAGVIVIVAGWACFAYSIWRNLALARDHR